MKSTSTIRIVLLASSALMGALALGEVASANTYDFLETFEASGTIGGKTFTDKLIDLTGFATAAPVLVNPDPSNQVYNIQLLSEGVSGILDTGQMFSAQFLVPSFVFSFSSFGNAGFGTGDAVLAGTYSPSSFVGFDLSHSIGPVVGLLGTQAYTNFAATTSGYFILDPGTGSSTFQEVVSTVPEPSTWALMIAGIGVVGATLRFRRRSGSPATA
jgi:hypothetical protein